MFKLTCIYYLFIRMCTKKNTREKTIHGMQVENIRLCLIWTQTHKVDGYVGQPSKHHTIYYFMQQCWNGVGHTKTTTFYCDKCSQRLHCWKIARLMAFLWNRSVFKSFQSKSKKRKTYQSDHRLVKQHLKV